MQFLSLLGKSNDKNWNQMENENYKITHWEVHLQTWLLWFKHLVAKSHDPGPTAPKKTI